MIKASKIYHRGEDRLRLDFPYDTTVINKIRQIKGSAWSQTLHAWHVPYTNEVFENLKNMLPDLELPILQEKTDESVNKRSIISEALELKHQDRPVINERNKIKIDVIGRKIILKMPKNDADIKFINTLKYSHWDARMFCWDIPNYPGNLDLINDHFKDRIDELVVHDK
jgi:integrase/recombinase XerD